MSSSMRYAKHLQSVIKYNDENYSELLRWMETRTKATSSDENPFVYIVDSQSDNTLKFYQFLGHGEVGSRLDELQNAIFQPDSTNIQTRLVIMNTRQRHLSPDLIDILGMAYDIEPQYFLSIVSEHEQYQTQLPVTSLPQSNAEFIHLDLIEPPGWADTHNHAWIKIARQAGHSMNIVVIILSAVADGLARRRARIALRPSQTSRAYSAPKIENSGKLEGTSKIDTYLEDLNAMSKEAVQEADATPMNYICPLIQGFEVVIGKALHNLERCHQRWLLLEPTERTASEDDELCSKWRDERLCLENTDSMIREVRRYMNRKAVGPNPGLDELLVPIGCLVKEGRTLEEHVRDQLNLHVGSLSLEDSRKSIEESKRSIKQANAMGRVTVLAFVFLPLSLVTSFFGMNVKEISGSGSSLRTFLTVAGALTSATFVFWGCWHCTSIVLEAIKRLRMEELERMKSVTANREKGKLKQARKQKYITFVRLWKELGPESWWQSATAHRTLYRSTKQENPFLSHLEGEV